MHDRQAVKGLERLLMSARIFDAGSFWNANRDGHGREGAAATGRLTADVHKCLRDRDFFVGFF